MPPIVSDEYLEARRSQIIDAALRCFVAKGFSRTTMQDIFAASGMSPGAVYNYFRSKHDIVMAMADESLARSRRLIQGMLSVSETPLDGLLGFFFRTLAKDQRAVEFGPFDLELFSEASRDPRLAEVLRRQADALLETMAEVVRREQEGGGVRSELDPRAVAQVIVSLWYGVFLGRVADPGADLDAYATVIEAAFHGGIRGGE